MYRNKLLNYKIPLGWEQENRLPKYYIRATPLKSILLDGCENKNRKAYDKA